MKSIDEAFKDFLSTIDKSFDEKCIDYILEQEELDLYDDSSVEQFIEDNNLSNLEVLEYVKTKIVKTKIVKSKIVKSKDCVIINVIAIMFVYWYLEFKNASTPTDIEEKQRGPEELSLELLERHYNYIIDEYEENKNGKNKGTEWDKE